MHSKKITKLTLDIVLTIIFISLIYPRETGFNFHEIAGLCIAFLFLVHIGLNWSWFKNLTKNLFNPRLKSKPKLFYLMDCISFIGIAVIIITGIMISRVLFPAQGMISHSAVLIHKWTSYFCLVWFGLHIVLHWKFLAETVPRLFQGSGKPAILRLGVIVLVLGVLYSQIAAANSEDEKRAQASQAPSRIDSQSQYRPRGGHDRTWDSSSSGRPSEDYNTPGSTSDQNGISDKSGISDQNSAVQSSENPLVSADNTSTTIPDQGSSINSNDSSGNTGDQASLSEFLGKMFCTGCEKHCSLLALRCDRGLPQLEAAKQQYQAVYESASVN